MAMRTYATGVTFNCGRMREKMLVIEMLPHLKILQKKQAVLQNISLIIVLFHDLHTITSN